MYGWWMKEWMNERMSEWMNGWMECSYVIWDDCEFRFGFGSFKNDKWMSNGEWDE